MYVFIIKRTANNQKSLSLCNLWWMVVTMWYPVTYSKSQFRW